MRIGGAANRRRRSLAPWSGMRAPSTKAGQVTRDRKGASSAYHRAIAIELGLKAYLLHRGITDQWNRIQIRQTSPRRSYAPAWLGSKRSEMLKNDGGELRIGLEHSAPPFARALLRSWLHVIARDHTKGTGA